MIQEHAAAVLSLLAAAPLAPALVVHDGAVPDGVGPPYVLVYFADTDPELSGSRPLTGQSRRYVLRVYAHCVGGNQDAARKVSDRVRAALLDVAPTVAGRSCFPIRREDGQPPQRNEGTGALTQDKVDVYRLESIPG